MVFHVPCLMMCCERYMEISMYVAICFVKEEKNWWRLPELLINLPIAFKTGKIKKNGLFHAKRKLPLTCF